jgi:hypothetical protein
MYLYGSLSSGDFNPDTSDIDFLVVTDHSLSEERITALESMHIQIWASGMKWSDKLEGSYIPQKDIRRYRPDNPPCPTINKGKFSIHHHGSDWIIQRHIVREYGVVIASRSKTLIDPITPGEVQPQSWESSMSGGSLCWRIQPGCVTTAATIMAIPSSRCAGRFTGCIMEASFRNPWPFNGQEKILIADGIRWSSRLWLPNPASARNF